MTEGDHARGSVMSMATQKEAPGLRLLPLRCRTKRRSLDIQIKATVRKLRAKVPKKRAEIERMKKELNEMKAKGDEMESECAQIREDYKLAIEKNAQIQRYVDSMVHAFVCAGNGGA